ncbi:SulP family inorganic anion transporter [Testudinibacter sp. TR-2022]|uniref:SulP family inorganic anion transporter n=1 Tax=Testudinibacter sp. TR-2022 TaxID=2585029 RepID=UPI001117F16A|nr:SulP family inorganic anion transporter [Testudinibacter sp. TR-2022]TNH05013.1 STAS domain-containing protein [Pasteurellaceae bacterium Phil11]TNH21331.1 STAS domain-containing protein [Testudinibacter sp. TR-2022]TNH26479.1 STAS domain-containing protein [Testudinibacter sp. TR-2022]
MFAITEAYKSGLFSRKHWLNNIIAGVIVGIVALPLAMAFAIASGAKPEQGIYTSIIAGFCTTVFGGSRLQISGPTGAFIVVLAGITAQYGIEGLQIATLMAGVILLAFGLSKMGAIIKYIPAPVIVGFTAGIAVIIWIGQWKDFFGLPAVEGVHFHEKLWNLLQVLPQFHPTTALLAILALFVVLYSSHIPGLKRIPGPLIALLLISIVQFIFQFDGVRTIGTAFGGIPQGLPEFKLPSVSWTKIIELIGPAFTIAMLGAIESLLSAVVADGMAGTRHNSNQELVGQGIANIAAPLFGGFAATGAIARTATNIRNGATSPLAGIVHCLTLVVILLVLAPLAVHIPLAVLSAILFVVAWNMSEAKRFIKMIKRAPKSDVAILLITFGLTVFADLVVAVNIGVILATLLFLRRMAGSVEVKRVSQADLLAHTGEEALPEELLVFTVDGPFFFGAVENFDRALADSQTYPKYLIIRLKWVPFIDMTGIQSLENVICNLQRQGVNVMLSGANYSVTQKLRRGGIIQLIGEHNMFKLFDDALRTAQSELKQLEDSQQ